MKVNLTKSPPIVYEKGNAALCRNGNVIIGFKCELQESYTLGEKDNERVIDTITGAFKGFNGNSLVHKMDVVKTKPYRFPKEYKKGGGYLRRKFVEFHEKRSFREQSSYVFFVWTMSELFGRDYISNPFMGYKQREKKIIDQLEDTQFFEAVKTAVSYVKNSKTFRLKELPHGHISELASSYFMGFEERSDVDIEKTEDGGLAVGGQEVAMYVLGSLHQLPDQLTSVVENKDFTDKDSKFYEGLMDGFGVNFECDHVVNQVIYFPDHGKLVDSIKKRQQDFYGTRKEGFYNEKAKSLIEYLKELSEKAGEKLVRTHFNVILYAPKKKLNQARFDLERLFHEREIKPYRPTGKRLWGMYASSFFGFISGLPSKYAYISKIEEAALLWLRTSGYEDDKDGLYFFDRDQMKPVIRDLWDDDNKRLKARNFMIIAETGEGKSSAAQHMIYQQLDQGTKVVVNDLGKSFQNMTRFYGKRAAHFEFEEGKALGLNPFEIKNEDDLTTTFINELVDFVNLLAFKTMNEAAVDEQTKISLRKIIKKFYETGSNPSLDVFYKFIKYLIKNPKMMEAIEVDAGRIDLEGYEYALQEFVGDGMYAFLFKKAEERFVIEDKDLLVYEFDKAKGDRLLLSILMGFSYQGTKKVIWEDKSVRGILLFEEFAKQLKFPDVVDTCEYYSQAIRKQYAAVGYVIQNVSQVPATSTAQSILDNTQVFHLFPGDHTKTIERLNLNEHRAYMAKSLKSNFDAAEPYSEILQLYGKKFENIVRITLPKEHYYGFQTEGRLYNKIEQQYENGKSIESIVEQMAKAGV
ncbi:VirB4 family type IV secretion system protein [Ekhidna sp.]